VRIIAFEVPSTDTPRKDRLVHSQAGPGGRNSLTTHQMDVPNDPRSKAPAVDPTFTSPARVTFTIQITSPVYPLG
jgi:hypothetical protein